MAPFLGYLSVNWKRIGLHLGFWLLFFGMGLYNELFLSSSFLTHPTSELAIQGTLAQLCLLSVKILTTYYFLYLFIPRWVKLDKRIRLYVEAFFVLCLSLLVYRVLMHFVIWTHIYHDEHGKIGAFEYLARLFYSLFDILLVVGIASAIKLFKLRISAMKNEKELTRQKLETEMQHLKAQVNPHFLFNCLTSIYSLAKINSDLTPDSIMRLSKILRYVLYESEKKMTSLEEELKIIEDYTELQKLRFGSRIKLEIVREIDNSLELVPPLLILPLLENAFKHGAGNTSSDPAFILMKIELKKKKLHVMIENTISTISVNEEKDKGIGLSNVTRRLELQFREFEFIHGKKEGKFIVNLNVDLSTYAGFELFDSRG